MDFHGLELDSADGKNLLDFVTDYFLAGNTITRAYAGGIRGGSDEPPSQGRIQGGSMDPPLDLPR